MDYALNPALNAFAITFDDRMPESETTLTKDAAYTVDLTDPPLTLGCVGGSLVTVLRDGLRRWVRAAARAERGVPQCMSLELATFESGRAAAALDARKR